MNQNLQMAEAHPDLLFYLLQRPKLKRRAKLKYCEQDFIYSLRWAK